MRPTTLYLKAEIRRLSVLIERISRKPKEETQAWAPTLRDLVREFRELAGGAVGRIKIASGHI